MKKLLRTTMPGETLAWSELVVQHFQWYPLMESRDVYKLLYQGVMGSEHLISSPEQYTRWLAEEFASLDPDPAGRLLEPVRPDQALLRLNLRAYKHRYSQVDALFSPLLETGRVASAGLTALQSVWSQVVTACDQGFISSLEPGALHAFSSWLDAQGFPAVHHSSTYRQHYQPAYRLIAHLTARRLGLEHAG